MVPAAVLPRPEPAVTVTNEAELACFDADVVYTDVWTSMGSEAEAAHRQEIFRPYQVNAKLFGCAKPDGDLPALPTGPSRR